MKRRSILTVLALAAVCCLLFAGCAGNAKYPDASMPMQDGGWNYNNKEAFYDGAAPDNAAAPMDPGSTDPQLPLNRKVIRNAELKAETLEFDAMMSALNAKVNELGGYVQSNSVNGRSYGSKTALRTAHMVARIPAEKLDEFLTAVDGLGNVISRNEKVDDVTDSYVDIEARLASLRTEYQTLLDLLSKAQCTIVKNTIFQERIIAGRCQVVLCKPALPLLLKLLRQNRVRKLFDHLLSQKLHAGGSGL